jgi:hypothetical protein
MIKFIKIWKRNSCIKDEKRVEFYENIKTFYEIMSEICDSKICSYLSEW